MQVSIFPNIPVSSSALLHLKMAIITQCIVRKLLFSPNLDWFSEIHSKLEQQGKKKGWKEKEILPQQKKNEMNLSIACLEEEFGTTALCQSCSYRQHIKGPAPK